MIESFASFWKEPYCHQKQRHPDNKINHVYSGVGLVFQNHCEQTL